MTWTLPLADISGEVIGALIALGVALFTWLREQATKKAEAAPPPKRPEAPIRGEASREQAEEDRMRKFMEALGLPADAAPRRETPPPLRPAERPPARRASIPPVPPIVAQDRPRRPRQAAPPPMPQHRERSLDEAGPPLLPVEQIRLPELEAAAMPEHKTVSGSILAAPAEFVTAAEAKAFRLQPSDRESALPSEVRALLRSPGTMRSAVLLREILGAPRGLQAGGFTHTFPSP